MCARIRGPSFTVREKCRDKSAETSSGEGVLYISMGCEPFIRLASVHAATHTAVQAQVVLCLVGVWMCAHART